MDYTIANNAKLFDELIEVLNNHQDEPGVIVALDDLKAAKINYTQRSIDHMMNCLVLFAHDLVVNAPSEDLRRDLASMIHRYYSSIMNAGPRLAVIASDYEARGGKPSSRDEILKE